LKQLLSILALCAISGAAHAQRVNFVRQHPSSAPGCTAFIGPADIAASPAAFYGTQAVNCAYVAPGTNPSLTVVRASDGTAQTIPIMSNGNINIAVANTFAGVDATASCTAASTTLTCTGASSTPHANDPISGTGITEPAPTGAFIVSCSTFVAGAGTCTLNVAQTVSVATTVTFAVVMGVLEAFDQTGNGQNLVQAVPANQPQLLPNCGNSLPCVSSNGNQWLQGGTTTVPVPWTVVAVMQSTSTAEWAIGNNVTPWAIGFNNGVNNFSFNAGGEDVQAQTGGVVHVFQVINGQLVIPNQFSFVDASGLTSNGFGTNSLTTPYAIGALSGGASAFVGTWTTVGTWPVAFSPTLAASMCHQLHLNQATPTTC
jgi:hypothetical protein